MEATLCNIHGTRTTTGSSDLVKGAMNCTQQTGQGGVIRNTAPSGCTAAKTAWRTHYACAEGKRHQKIQGATKRTWPPREPPSTEQHANTSCSRRSCKQKQPLETLLRKSLEDITPHVPMMGTPNASCLSTSERRSQRHGSAHLCNGKISVATLPAPP